MEPPADRQREICGKRCPLARTASEYGEHWRFGMATIAFGGRALASVMPVSDEEIAPTRPAWNAAIIPGMFWKRSSLAPGARRMISDSMVVPENSPAVPKERLRHGLANPSGRPPRSGGPFVSRSPPRWCGDGSNRLLRDEWLARLASCMTGLRRTGRRRDTSGGATKT